jgi:hypothetical protein
LAVVFKEAGIPFKIFELSGANGGVWNMDNKKFGLANNESTVQNDPVIYAPTGWFLQEGHEIDIDENNKFRGMHSPVSTVLKNVQEIIDSHGIMIDYHRKVTAFHCNKDGTVSVTWEDTKSKERRVETFAGVHFRTGNLNKAKNTPLPHEDRFEGETIVGCKKNSDNVVYSGKTVVVIGWGSFAIENIMTAIRRGAKKVHVVARNPKPHWFSYATYFAGQFYSPNAADPTWGPAVWDKIFDANQTAANACGVQNTFYSPDVYTEIDGKPHYFFKGGLINGTVDPVAIGMHYGVIEYHQGTVADVLDHAVVLNSGARVDADVVVKCTGFNVDCGPVSGHVMRDSIFVDGHVNVTSYHGIDGCGEPAFAGPNVPVTNSFLVSVFGLENFDQAIVYFMNNPDIYEAFKQFPMFSRVAKAESLGYISFMYVFNKIFAFGDENIISFFMKNMTTKQAEYDKVLDEQKFLKYDRMRWDAWSELFALQTGKPVLSYPFLSRMEKKL